MNIGNVFFNIIKALVEFGSKITDFLNAKINIDKLLDVIKILGIDVSSLPTEINVLTLIGSISGVAILTFFVIKIIRG